MDLILNWFSNNQQNVIELIMALVLTLEIITNLTPSEKDNSILLKIKKVISMVIPNRNNTGGTHE